MKRIFTLLLALALVLSLAACGGGSASSTEPPASQGNAETSAAASNAPGGGHVGGNAGNDTGNWQASFGEASGVPGLPAFPDSDVTYDSQNPRTVIFTVSSDISNEAFLSYAREVFTVCQAVSPDGIYDIDYEGFKKGAEVSKFSDETWDGMLMAYWYYTDDGYISQMYLSVEGNTLTVKINDVYNTDTSERAKP